MRTKYNVGSFLKAGNGETFAVDTIEINLNGIGYVDSKGNKYAEDEIAAQFREVKPRAKANKKTSRKTTKVKAAEAEAA